MIAANRKLEQEAVDAERIVALLLHYLHKLKDFVVRESPKDLLGDLSREDLIVIIPSLCRSPLVLSLAAN